MPEALLIFKPDASYRLAVRAEIWSWLDQQRDLELGGLRWFRPPQDLIESHYDFLRGRPFFPWLIDFMTALPLVVGKVSAEPDVLERLRYELGETRIHESRPGSLREKFGIFGGVNCLHLSDSVEAGAHEVELWTRHVQLEGVEAQLEASSDAPDHTFHLRSLASQFSNGVHQDLAGQEIKRLLKEESRLEGPEFESLLRVVLGALA
jgi:nucleoside-diphosphate kinase